MRLSYFRHIIQRPNFLVKDIKLRKKWKKREQDDQQQAVTMVISALSEDLKDQARDRIHGENLLMWLLRLKNYFMVYNQ